QLVRDPLRFRARRAQGLLRRPSPTTARRPIRRCSSREDSSVYPATMSKVIAAVLCLAAMPLCAQEDSRVTWLAQHAVRVRSVDPADDDFRDLEPLRATLQGVRVVMLGEQDHGDGTTFL